MKRLFLILVLMSSGVKAMAMADDSWNVRFSPFGLMIGLINAEIDYKVNDHFIVGPAIETGSTTIDRFTLSTSGFGAQGAHYFDGVHKDGFYFGGRFSTFSFSVEETTNTGDKRTASASGTALGLKGGYHWFWESFNLNLGLTAMSGSVRKVQIKDQNGNLVKEVSIPSAGAGIEFMTGFTF